MLEPAEIERFLDLAQRLPSLTPAEVRELSIVARPGLLDAVPVPTGIFELGRPSQGATSSTPDDAAHPAASGASEGPDEAHAGGPGESGPGEGAAGWTMHEATDDPTGPTTAGGN